MEGFNSIQQHNLDLALTLASQGVFVFPCNGRGERRKTPCPGMAWRSMSSIDPRTIKAWWNRWPDAVPAINMGRSKLIAIDCDRKLSDGRAWLEGRYGSLDHVPGGDTPSGGRHFIFKNPLKLGNSRGDLPPKSEADIDVRGDGGYIIAPGARFTDGAGTYTPIGSLANVADMPGVLAAILEGKGAIPLPPIGGSRPNPLPPPIPRPDPRPRPPSPPPAAHAVSRASMGNGATYVPPEPITDWQREAYGRSALDGAAAELATAQVGERNELANAKAYHLGRLVGGGYLAQGEAYSALEQAGFALGLHPRDKLFGAKGTLWRAIQDGIKNPYDPLAGREGLGVTIDLKKGLEPEWQQPQRPTITATPYVWIDPSKIPLRQWVYGTHLIRKFGSATIAHGGVGKSSLMIVEALAMVTGRALLGILPRGKFKVWFWNGEDPMEEIQRRIAATCLHFGITRPEIEGRLFVNSGRDRDNEIVIAKEVRPSGVIINRPIIEALQRTITDNGIDVLQIDPFISSHQVNENDNVAIDRVVKEWTKLADVTGTAIDLAHHSRKTGGNAATVEDGRGASSLLGAVRSARVLNAMTADEAAKCGIATPRSYIKLTNGKLNLARPPDKDDWCLLRSVWLMNGDPKYNLDFGDDVGVATPWKWPDAMEGVTENDFDKVAAVIQAGNPADEGRPWRLSAQARGWVGYAVALALAPRLDLTNKADKAKVSGMLRVWLGTRRLLVVKLPDWQRKPRESVVVRVEKIEINTQPDIISSGPEDDFSDEGPSEVE